MDSLSLLVSELVKQKDSQEVFNYISTLIISCLHNYESKHFSEDNLHKEKNNLSEFNSTTFNGLNQIKTKNDYLTISNDIHSILLKCPDLSNNEKLEYCNSQRYFMKLFLRNLLNTLNK